MCETKKICRICKIEKPITSEYFTRYSKNLDGFNNMCKVCKNNTRYRYPEKTKEYYSKNKDILNAKSTERYFKRKAINPKIGSEHYHKHKHKHKEKYKLYRDSTKEKTKLYNKQYKLKNKEKCRALSKKSDKKQADILSDSYVKGVIITKCYNRNIHLKVKDIPQELVDSTRSILLLERKLYNNE